MYKVVFMGTPDYAVPALQCLIDCDEFDVKLVISQTDKPQGRKQIMTPPPVKQLALQYNLPVYQPDTLKTDEAFDKISEIAPDFIVVSAYGKILPKRILDIPVYGCVNLHGSLLPKYRGAAPIQWSVINGDKVTGVTTMLMDVGIDTGDILLKSEKIISPTETAGEVFDALASMCPEILLKTLFGLIDGSVKPVKQNEDDANYVSVLTKDMAEIDWNDTSFNIHNKVRGMNPWPVAKTCYNGKVLKVFATEITSRKTQLKSGSVVTDDGKIVVACSDGVFIQIKELQLEGAKRMSAEDFLRGHTFESDYSFISEV